jgi:hypothetical protein
MNNIPRACSRREPRVAPLIRLARVTVTPHQQRVIASGSRRQFSAQRAVKTLVRNPSLSSSAMNRLFSQSLAWISFASGCAFFNICAVSSKPSAVA